MATISCNGNNELYFVQSQPLLQYGPLTLDQLKELYIYEIVHDNSFIARCSSLKNQKTNQHNTTNTPFRIIPNEEPLWSPIHSMDAIYAELEEAMLPYNKNHKLSKQKSAENASNNNNSNNSKLNFQVNMNMHTSMNMDINMNITNNLNHHQNKNINLTKKQLQQQRFEINALKERNAILNKLNKDLQQEIVSLKAKYQSQFIDLRTKLLKQFEEYKKQKNKIMENIKSQNNILRMQRNQSNDITKQQIMRENEEYSAEISKLKSKQSRLIDENSEFQMNLIYYKTKYKALQCKYDLNTFNYDKYKLDLSSAKEQILQKQHIIDHSHQIVNALLKNTICQNIPFEQSLHEIEGNHHLVTKKYAINRSCIRLDALKISELTSWHNFCIKFHSCMDVLTEYEQTSHRSRSRMKNVVSMLGEKVKSLNVRNLSPSDLIHLSRDLKQSYESISSEQHLKEFELSNQRQKFLNDFGKTMPTLSSVNTLSQITETPKSVTHGGGHHFGSSFGSMASLSMTDIHSRNMSLHSLSPSLDGTESIISKHRTKSGTIKGSGLRLLTNEDTLNKYLDNGNGNGSHQHQHQHQHKKNNRSLSTGKYRNYSAFQMNRNKRNKQHYGQSSVSSNVSFRSLYNYHPPSADSKKVNGSNTSMSELSELCDERPRLNTIVSMDENKEENVVSNDENVDENVQKSETLSNDILSFFAM